MAARTVRARIADDGQIEFMEPVNHPGTEFDVVIFEPELPAEDDGAPASEPEKPALPSHSVMFLPATDLGEMGSLRREDIYNEDPEDVTDPKLRSP